MSVFADMTDRQQPSVESREPSSNVVSLPSRISAAAAAKAEYEAIDGHMRDYCEMRRLEKLQAREVILMALAVWRNGLSPAMAIEEGRKTADIIAARMKKVRAELGLRDDDDPTPPARAA